MMKIKSRVQMQTKKRNGDIQSELHHQGCLWCPAISQQSRQAREDLTCSLCLRPTTLKHILVGCKTSLTKGSYTWPHIQVLLCLAAVSGRASTQHFLPLHHAVRQQHLSEKVRVKSYLADQGQIPDCWSGHVIGRLDFPAVIASTNLRPDLVLWSASPCLHHKAYSALGCCGGELRV